MAKGQYPMDDSQSAKDMANGQWLMDNNQWAKDTGQLTIAVGQ